MKNIKDWFSYDLLSKSLLSARPFSFFYEESPDGELGNQDSIMSMSTTSTADHPSDVPQPTASENSYLAQYEEMDKDSDPLTQIEALQIKFLRIIQRISISPSNPLVSQVLYRLQLASLIRAGETNSKKPTLKPNQALEIASSLEARNPSNLSFSFKILLIGKTGVGKSSTINSIFDQLLVPTNAFQPATEKIHEITRTIKGITVTIVDTPGLSPSCQDHKKNRKILHTVKRYIKNSPPDVVLYLERLDVINRGCNDHRLMKLINDVFGASIWCHTIIGMTHSSSYPPHDISYDSFTSQSTTLLQHHIHQAIQSTEIQNQILLIENHPNCRKNAKGENILPNGQVWMSQLLLLCASTKVLGDANSILKFNKRFQIVKTKRTRMPSLPHFLSTLLHPQNFSEESDEISNDVEDEYDQLPPIRVLSKSQYQKLSGEQRNAYLDELEYRETLYLKKQWNEEVRRRKEKSPEEFEGENPQEIEQLPDVNIPSSFDHDCESYRYRCLMSSNAKWIMRPVLNSQGWDHDVGFDGINLEASTELNSTLKTSFVGQISKDKEEFNIQSESAAIYNNPNGISLLTGIDVHGSDKRFVFTIHGDANHKSFGCNTIGTGFTLTSFEKSCLLGAKIEDSICIGRRIKLMANAGKLLGEGQVANGGTFEVIWKDKDFPVRDEKVKLAASVLSFEKEMVIGGNMETDFRVGRNAKFSVNGNLNNKRMGQLRLKFSVTDNNKIGLIAIVSLLQALFRGRRSELVEGY